jgi:hypothetical protein
MSSPRPNGGITLVEVTNPRVLEALARVDAMSDGEIRELVEGEPPIIVEAPIISRPLTSETPHPRSTRDRLDSICGYSLIPVKPITAHAVSMLAPPVAHPEQPKPPDHRCDHHHREEHAGDDVRHQPQGHSCEESRRRLHGHCEARRFRAAGPCDRREVRYVPRVVGIPAVEDRRSPLYRSRVKSDSKPPLFTNIATNTAAEHTIPTQAATRNAVAGSGRPPTDEHRC